MTLYLDLDGVFADFNAHLLSYNIINDQTFHHLHPSTHTKDQKELRDKVETCMKLPGFWEELPMCPGAEVLWDYCQQYNPVILTATPNIPNFDEKIKQEKQNWINKYFGFKTPVIYCLRSEKVHYIDSVQDILLDDTVRNVQEWTEAGGLGILHTDIDNSIKKLDYLYKEYFV